MVLWFCGSGTRNPKHHKHRTEDEKLIYWSWSGVLNLSMVTINCCMWLKKVLWFYSFMVLVSSQRLNDG